MPKLVPSVIGSAGIIGSCCAVTIPLTLNTSPVFSDGEGDKALVSNTVSKASDQDTSKPLTFEDLWNQIVLNYREKQLPISTERNLSWKENLQKRLNENTENRSWIVKFYEWKNCVVNQEGHSTDCGYIHLNGQNVDYKLKINYEYLGQKGQWRIYIVKNKQGKVSFYDNSISRWNEKNNISFDKLSSSTTSHDGWNFVTAPAFIQEA